jgi:hypothetical protein
MICQRALEDCEAYDGYEPDNKCLTDAHRQCPHFLNKIQQLTQTQNKILLRSCQH